MMKALLACIAVFACLPASLRADLEDVSGLSCPKAGYMFPDSQNLCFVHYCTGPGATPIKRPCPKGVRVPSWWEGGELNMCFVVNILKHYGEPTCHRCAANDIKPADNCADYESPCGEDCTCEDIEYTHRCDCPNTGVAAAVETVEAPENHCEPEPCVNGGTCQNQWDGYFCFCPNGYTGHRCETPICDWHPCFNGGTCVVDEVGFRCECTECWTGSCCNVTLPECKAPEAPECGPCETGADCKTPIRSCGCQSDLCVDNGVCVDGDNGPECQACDECMTGPLCKAKLDSCKCNNDCPENSRCEDLIDSQSHECICDDCYEGSKCQTKKNTCECNNPCPEGATCSQLDDGSLTCGCSDPCKTGDQCQDTINSCECANPCTEGQECSKVGEELTCSCSDPCMTGADCKTPINTCECNNPCTEGQECSKVGEELTCSCSDPCMTGADCKTPINTCECNNPCPEGQECSKVGDELTCSCSNPCMTGEKCDTMLQTCGCSDPCEYGGTCAEGPEGLMCEDCPDCTGGALCEEKIISCDCNSPCAPGEVCNLNDDGKPVCGCADCMTGESCDVPIESCECNNPCTNKDTCQDTENGPVCECDCVGNEECKEDPNTGLKKCVCPNCFYNEGDERGCQSTVEHLCVCNNPCTEDQQVCVDAEEGEQPTCKIGNPSAGNAFTVVFEENHTEKSFRQIPLELYLTPSVPDSGNRMVNIRSAGLPKDNYCYFNVNRTIPENDVLRFTVDRCMMHNKTGLDRVSIRLTELNNDAMIVYGINKDRWSADGFLATPDAQAGMEFQTVSYSPAHRGTQFAIAALYDDTEIEMMLADNNDLPPPYNKKGSTFRMTMNAFETFQVQAACEIKRGSKKSVCPEDLTGSHIKASRPIHVFSGNIRAFIEAGKGLSRDHLVEELLPIDRWGKYFALMTVPTRAVGDILNIMAVQGQTTRVTMQISESLSGPAREESFTLPQNGRVNIYKEVPSGARVCIKADKALSVTQLTKSKDVYLYNNETVHDPVSITVPPVEQFTNFFFISTPMFTGGKNFSPKPYESTFAMLVAKAGEEGDVSLDNQPLRDFISPWQPMPSINGGEDLVGAVIEIPHGTRLIKNDKGKNMQCLLYGFDDRESWGFPAAMNFAKIN